MAEEKKESTKEEDEAANRFVWKAGDIEITKKGGSKKE